MVAVLNFVVILICNMRLLFPRPSEERERIGPKVPIQETPEASRAPTTAIPPPPSMGTPSVSRIPPPPPMSTMMNLPPPPPVLPPGGPPPQFLGEFEPRPNKLERMLYCEATVQYLVAWIKRHGRSDTIMVKVSLRPGTKLKMASTQE